MAGMRKAAIPLLICEVIFLVAATIFVILRLVSIRILRRKFKAHDVLCVVSLVRECFPIFPRDLRSSDHIRRRWLHISLPSP